MILTVDIGNSYVKCAVVDGGRVIGGEKLETKRYQNPVAVSDMIRRVTGTVLSIDRAILSSVVPKATVMLSRAIELQLGTGPMVVDCNMRLPFRLAVSDPSQVGADRLCSAAGAVGTKRRNAIVIDAGSAITIDVVRDKEFRGGIIAAGPDIALGALHTCAGQLPAIDYSASDVHFPKTFDTTRTAMTLGAGLGSVGVIREAVRFLEKAVGMSPRKYITGGFGGVLASHLPESWRFDPDLTRKGLYVIASLNRRRSDRDPKAHRATKRRTEKPVTT
jgi:type III pantothenate kinase